MTRDNLFEKNINDNLWSKLIFLMIYMKNN